MNILAKICFKISEIFGRWLHPNRYPDKEVKIKQPKPKKEALSKMSAQQIVDNENLCALDFKEMPQMFSFDDALFELKELDFDECLYHHDSSCHEIACKFNQGDYSRYQARSDKARKKLKPLLYPKQGKPYDRTHLIPIGFHGSENDYRLVVGWDSYQNRNTMKNFEEEVKNLNELQSVIWVTMILKTDDGAKWETRIYDLRGKQLLSKTFELTTTFVWKN